LIGPAEDGCVLAPNEMSSIVALQLISDSLPCDLGCMKRCCRGCVIHVCGAGDPAALWRRSRMH